LGEGEHNTEDLLAAGGKNNEISSLKVFKTEVLDVDDDEEEEDEEEEEEEELPPICLVTVFETADFDGWSASFVAGDYDFSDFRAAGAEDNDVESIIVQGEECVATAWEN
jgi:hypothetical protein